MNRILIIGVAGFLGSNLANYLLNDENNLVFGIDNFSYSNMSFLYPILKSERFNLTEQDATDEIPFSVDCVYNCCGCNNLKNIENKYDYVEKQIDVTKNILKYTKLTGSKLVVLSQFNLLNKNDKFLESFSDFINELILEYKNNYKIDVKIANIFNAYGKNLPKASSNFIQKTINTALNNEDITLKNNNLDYFIYVDDVVKILEKIMNTYIDYDVIDIASDELFLEYDVAKYIIKELNSNSKIEMLSQELIKPSKQAILKLNELNIDKYTSIYDGIKSTIKFDKLMFYS